MNVTFLTLDEVVEIHQEQIDLHGGDPSLRDLGLLQSAVAMPQSTFGGPYLHDFPVAMAAAYLYHLVQNHPFVDGNKRTGLAAALVFLEMNDHSLSAPKDDVERLVLEVASGNLDKDGVTDFSHKHVRKT